MEKAILYIIGAICVIVFFGFICEACFTITGANKEAAKEAAVLFATENKIKYNDIACTNSGKCSLLRENNKVINLQCPTMLETSDCVVIVKNLEITND